MSLCRINHHAKMCRGGRRTAPHVLNVSSNWGEWSASWSGHYRPRHKAPAPFRLKNACSSVSVWRLWRKVTFLYLPGIQSQIQDSPARSLVILPTDYHGSWDYWMLWNSERKVGIQAYERFTGKSTCAIIQFIVFKDQGGWNGEEMLYVNWTNLPQ